MIKFSYAELDQRIRVIETGFQTLKIRLDRLEEAQWKLEECGNKKNGLIYPTQNLTRNG